MMLRGHIKPIWGTWHRDQDYVCRDRIYPESLYQQWLQAGHQPRNLVLHSYGQPMPMPDFILNLAHHWPGYHDFGFTIHRIDPGCYLPQHQDAYHQYRQRFDVAIENILRVVVFLEDWQPGQFNIVESTMVHSWQAGDWIGWHSDTPHSVANIGLDSRYAVIITAHQ